jgi:membrane protein YqaA with SNARE-associated domain
MSDPKNNPEASGLSEIGEVAPRPLPAWTKTAVFIFEIAFILVLLIWWLSSESIRQNKSLWVLFFYAFPAEFLIATVPHEPILLYFGKFYSPLTVALVSVGATLLTEILNYTCFKYVMDLRVFQKMLQSKAVSKTVTLFNKAPFAALWVAGFTPIPFYPFRFLVVLAKYPLAKYLLAVLTSRAPRMYLIALAGRAIHIPDYLLIVLFVVLITAANIPILRKVWQKKRRQKESPPTAP